MAAETLAVGKKVKQRPLPTSLNGTAIKKKIAASQYFLHPVFMPEGLDSGKRVIKSFRKQHDFDQFFDFYQIYC